MLDVTAEKYELMPRHNLFFYLRVKSHTVTASRSVAFPSSAFECDNTNLASAFYIFWYFWSKLCFFTIGESVVKTVFCVNCFKFFPSESHQMKHLYTYSALERFSMLFNVTLRQTKTLERYEVNALSIVSKLTLRRTSLSIYMTVIESVKGKYKCLQSCSAKKTKSFLQVLSKEDFSWMGGIYSG